MSDKFYQTKDFIELQKRWYEDLDDKGFRDIEFVYPDGNASHFTRPAVGSSSWPVDYAKALPTLAYFQFASKFLWDYPFKKPKHKHIWRLHSQGMSIRQIAKRVAKSEKSLNGVHLVINRLKIDFFVYIRDQVEWEDEQI